MSKLSRKSRIALVVAIVGLAVSAGVISEKTGANLQSLAPILVDVMDN